MKKRIYFKHDANKIFTIRICLKRVKSLNSFILLYSTQLPHKGLLITPTLICHCLCIGRQWRLESHFALSTNRGLSDRLTLIFQLFLYFMLFYCSAMPCVRAVRLLSRSPALYRSLAHPVVTSTQITHHTVMSHFAYFASRPRTRNTSTKERHVRGASTRLLYTWP